MGREIRIDGYSAEELLELPELEELVAVGRPIIFSVGSAEVLAEVAITGPVLKVELAVVDSGGEGVLAVLIDVIEHAARRNEFTAIDWIVYARNCANPNPKLDRVLSRLGFEVRSDQAEHYYRRSSTNQSVMDRH